MRQRFQSNRIAPYLLFVAATLFGGFLFLVPSAKAATVDITSNITSNTSWVASNVYIIENAITINSGVTLTIASGTVVKFNATDVGYDYTASIDVQGTLNAQGAATNKIYFTSINDNSVGGTNGSSTGNPAAGDWNDLEFDAGSSSTISNAIVRYGGGGYDASQSNIYITGGNFTLSNSQVSTGTYYGLYTIGGDVTITSSTLNNIPGDGGETLDGTGYGVEESDSSGTLAITSSSFSNNEEGAGYIDLSGGINFTHSGNSASGTNAGFLIEGTTATSTIWYKDNIPYIVTDVTVALGTTLTINHGTVVKLGNYPAGYTLYGSIDVQGSLNVQGTSTDKVYFTSLYDNSIDSGTSGSTTSTPNLGDWDALGFDSGSSSTITNAIVRYGGSTSQASYNGGNAELYDDGGNLTLSNSQVSSDTDYGLFATGGNLTITSTTFSNIPGDSDVSYDGTGYGISEADSSGTLMLASSTFSNNGGGVVNVVLNSGVNFVPSGNSASSSGINGFTISGTTAASTTWYKDLPYVIQDTLTISSGTTLTVNSGTIVKFYNDNSNIDNQGIFNVNGTSTNRIYFTSLNDNSIDPGTGGSTTSTPNPGDWGDIEIDPGASTTFNNAIIEYGAGGSSPSNIYQTGGKSTITNSQVTNSLNDGLNMTGGTSTISFSEFNNNDHGGIYLNAGMVTVSTSTIQGNVAYGFYNGDSATSTAVAEHNYWGSATGPTNPANPSGTGDVVSSYVDFTHWLTQSPLNGTTTLSALKQYKSDATTTINEGSSTTETVVDFGANLQSLGTASETLQVEVEPAGTAFMNASSVSSAWVAPSSTVTVAWNPAAGPESGSNGSYHWQARVLDKSGNASPWQLFGANASSTDFKISTIPLYTQVTSTYPSNSSTTGTVWWAPQLLDKIATNTISSFGCAITSVAMDLRSYGITTTTYNSSYMSSTDVNPANLNDWLENYNTSTTSTSGYTPAGSGLLNWQDIPYYTETSGTFRVWYQDTGTNSTSSDHTSVSSTAWVNYWLSKYPTGTVPVILTIPTSTIATQHFVVATGHAINQNTSTYTLRDPYYYNTMYLNQGTATNTFNYMNIFQGAHVFEPTSTTVLPLYLEYAIDSAHTLLITDANGDKLGIDPTTGVFYDTIPNSGEDDDEAGVRFLTIYTPAAGRYTLKVGGTGTYQLESFVADGTHMPTPQIISSSTTSAVPATYHQTYSATDLLDSVVGE
jgi:hypothetical protein